jgi:C4-dicarboxylate-specific signal transduction histidine kinase
MAHELSQPLASIALAAENALTVLAASPAETALVAQKLERISQQAARAAKLIDHMRFFGRRENGTAQPIDLSTALDGALLILDARLRRAKIEIVRDIASDLPQVSGTLVLVEQVMINLITNACDACKAARPALPKERRRIEVTAFAKGGTVVLIVADHAGGIPEADLPKVFQPFFTTKPAGEGMGLGLSISYGIVSDMGGTMIACNGQDGAVFELRLPANSEGATA